MKLFFKAFNSGNLNEIGHYPQTSLRKGYNPNLPSSIWNVKYNEFPDFILNYELELHKDAVPTNYIEGISNLGMIVDFKLKIILEKVNLPEHQFYPIKVYQNGKQIEYYYFHFVNNLLEYVDTKSSTLRIESNINKENHVILPFLSDTSLNTLINYYLMNIEYNLVPNKIILKDSFPNYDLFNNRPFGVDTIISKNLKKILDENNIQGLEYKIIKYFD